MPLARALHSALSSSECSMLCLPLSTEQGMMPVLPHAPACCGLVAAIGSLPMTGCSLVPSCSLDMCEGWKMATRLLLLVGPVLPILQLACCVSYL